MFLCSHACFLFFAIQGKFVHNVCEGKVREFFDKLISASPHWRIDW